MKIGMRSIRFSVLVLYLFSFLFPFSSYALDMGDNLSLSGTATSVYQWFNKAKGNVENKDRGSAVIDFNVSFKPTENDEFFMRARFARGSGLEAESVNYPFKLSSNADDLFINLHNINGHSLDHLQELWYAHKFNIQKDMFLKFSGGIIDSTRYIDNNVYANDELAQFMNEALFNNPIANLPSYDAGMAVEFGLERFHLRVVWMGSKNKNEDMDVRNYNWIGAQVGYKLETALGEGNYRLYGYTTNKRFENWDTDAYRALRGIGVSFDQQLIKETLGAFFRAGLQDTSAKVDYSRMFSFGLNLNGGVWGRKDDEVGIGYAYLKTPSKNEELKHSQVLEGYVKFQLFSYKTLSSNITLDYQYIQDKARESENTKAGHIYGVRLNVNF